MVPIPFMGDGIRRVLSIVLAIANAPGGVVLIDEVENGLHYSVMKDVWKAIALAARQFDVQVFATTHSWECILAAHHAFQESKPYELRYFRLDRVGDQISAKSLDEQSLTRIESTDLEIR
jgi:AAA15 family ATPase/GTPase